MKNRFKLEAAIMIVIPIVFILVGIGAVMFFAASSQ